MWRCFVRDQARVPSVAGAGSSLFRNRNNFFLTTAKRAPSSVPHMPSSPCLLSASGTHHPAFSDMVGCPQDPKENSFPTQKGTHEANLMLASSNRREASSVGGPSS